MSDEIISIRKVYRDPLFDRTLEDLRSQGGYGAVAASKADEFIGNLLGRRGGRDQFRFTRKGENRIRNCRKVDLGCGYRIVSIQKGERLVLLYIGTHDDCFRWIGRYRTAEYDLDGVPTEAWVDAVPRHFVDRAVWIPKSEEDRFSEACEKALQDRIDDAMLRKVFSGLTTRGPERA
jgi:hypothetical protein